MATRRTRRRTAGGSNRRTTPGWVLLVAGLALGIAAVVATLYVRERLAQHPTDTERTSAEPTARSKPRATPKPAPPEKDYGFYDLLPNSEVVVPKDDRDASADRRPAPIQTPGAYVVQAGSFRSFAEADKVKARLALLGIHAQIQNIAVDGQAWHRVRIGPIEDLAELDRVRRKLRTADIEERVFPVRE